MNNDIEELRRRLANLEQENRQLKEAAAQPGRSQSITTRVAEYKGHPVITIEGPFRPFSLGVRKAAAIVEKIDDLVAFVEKHNRNRGTSGEGDDEP